MARAPAEEPQGLTLVPDLITPDQEHQLLTRFDELRWDPIVIRGQAARRSARHFGLGYDYESRTPEPGEPIPPWLEAAHAAAAELGACLPRPWLRYSSSATRLDRRSAGTAMRPPSG